MMYIYGYSLAAITSDTDYIYMRIAKVLQEQSQGEEVISRMQDLELPDPPMVVSTHMVHPQQQTPTPPGPSHEFLEQPDTTEQARRKSSTRT